MVHHTSVNPYYLARATAQDCNLTAVGLKTHDMRNYRVLSDVMLYLCIIIITRTYAIQCTKQSWQNVFR